jgi:hypothetical protein
MPVPSIELDRQSGFGIREVEVDFDAAEDHRVLLPRDGEARGGDHPEGARLEIAVERVITGDAQRERPMHLPHRPSRRAPEPTRGAAQVPEVKDPSPQRIVHCLPQLPLAQPARHVDDRPGDCGRRDRSKDREVGVEQRP